MPQSKGSWEAILGKGVLLLRGTSDLIYRDTSVIGLHMGLLSLRKSFSILGTMGLRSLKADLHL